MAGKKENIKALFSNTRTRVIILFTAIILLIAITVGFIKFSGLMSPTVTSSADLASAPGGIQSIPGSMDQTAQYAALQQSQNIDQATQASKTGGSAIPTIIRTQAFGSGVQPVGPQDGGGVGFETLAREGAVGPQQSLWLQTLKESDCSQASVTRAVNQGAMIGDLKGACTCLQLKDAGYKINDLSTVCSCKDLKAIGQNARQMKDVGFTSGKLRQCGFDACELRAAGFTAQEMKDGGYSDGELKGAGYPDDDILKAGGLPDGISVDDVRKAGCQVDALAKLKAAGVTAAAIRRIDGCSAAQLKAAGYNAQHLKNAGFSAADLLKAGFNPAELKQAGFGARDLLDAGVTPADLLNAGYTGADVKSAEGELPPGMTPDSIKEAGCQVGAIKRERLAGVSALLIKQYAGCRAQALKEAGFTDDDLANAGFTPAEIKSAQAMPSDEAIKAAGCQADQLKQLYSEGVSAAKIHDLNGCSADDLKAAGYNAAEISSALVTPPEITAAGCDPQQLHALFLKGVAAKRIIDSNGCNATALKAAGFDAKDLSDAGVTPQDLLSAGFTPDEFNKAGLNPAAIIAAGREANCSVASLKAAYDVGVSPATIKQTLGCSAKQMKEAGYSAAQLKAAGFAAGELKDAGYTAPDLKNAGFTPKELSAAGFTAQDLKNAGFTPTQLKDAGFSAADLKNAGFNAEQLKAMGFSPKELKEAGFSAGQLKAVGYTAKELGQAGFSEAQLNQAGFSPSGSDITGLDSMSEPSIVSSATPIPSIDGSNADAASIEASNTKQLQEILKRQQNQMADQQHQQKIQQRMASMLGAANEALQNWKSVSTQTYISGTPPKNTASILPGAAGNQGDLSLATGGDSLGGPVTSSPALIKAGDVLFAILDTSVNSDEPSPILATIVSGKLKGSKLIGSFTLPTNADRMVINFNTMSVPGAAKTTSINAYAIDPNTARTALATKANHHYLLRYGSLFASTFLEGFGNAFQSANTTITIGGTGGTSNTTVSNGVGRSILENAVIGLATLGKTWGQVAQQQFNTPTTVLLCSGTGIGILFTQDLASL